MEKRKERRRRQEGEREKEKVKNIMFKRLWELMTELTDPQHLRKTEWAKLNDCGTQAESKSNWKDWLPMERCKYKHSGL
jgi:hypothetical protein